MDPLDAAQSMGMTLPSGGYMFGALAFGVIGFAAFRYGKKAGRTNPMLIGVALMLYPYFVSATWLMYLIGAGLCGALYWFRE